MRFTIEFGGDPLNCEIIGPEDAPVIAVLGGISADCHVTSSPDNTRLGWWESIAGSGKALDTRRFRVLSIDYAVRPVITTSDQADALALTLDAASVDRLYALIGASYGGMVALAFASSHGRRAERLLVIGAAHEAHPMATAHRALQRRVIELGRAADRTRDGVILARALAMTTYGTAAELASRFPATSHNAARGVTFPVENYLLRAGEQFATTCSPERYLALSLSLDFHRIQPEDVRVPTTLITVPGDRLVPRSQMRELAKRLGAPCEVIELRSRYGHDAFLKEPRAISAVVASVLDLSRSSGHRQIPRRSESRAQVGAL